MPGGKTGAEFTVAYDKLVIATGAEASTFGIKGVTEYAILLRDVKNARDIRTRLLLNLMLCEIPGMVCNLVLWTVLRMVCNVNHDSEIAIPWFSASPTKNFRLFGSWH